MQKKRKMDCASITEKKDCDSRKKDCQWNKDKKVCEDKEQKEKKSLEPRKCEELGKVLCKLRTDCTLKTDGTCTPYLYGE